MQQNKKRESFNKKFLRVFLIFFIIIFTVGLPYNSVQAYSYVGYKWSSGRANFYLDIAGWDPALIQGPASTWNNAGSPFRFKLQGQNVFKYEDGKNTVARYTLNSKSIAKTYTIRDGNYNLVEVDTVFDMADKWGCCGESDMYDVRNTMTHEFGHWLTLGDLTNWTWDREKTMYGSAATGETKKRTLHQDDINGINFIY